MPEKLLTIKEVADYLGLPEEEVKRLVDIGEIPAYKIGGTFLRFRKEQIDAIKTEVSDFEKEDTIRTEAAIEPEEMLSTPYTDLEREIKMSEPITRQYDYTLFEKVKDFLYFYDFYIISFAIILFLLFVIFKK